MILTAFRLVRDRSTETPAFGYKRSLWPGDTRPFRHHTPRLGSPIELDGRLTTKLVKIVELYQYAQPVVIERLAWQFGDQLLPYRVKYIWPHNKGVGSTTSMLCSDEPVLFLHNMSAIYRHLTGLDALFISPLQYYLDRVCYYPDTAPEIRDYLHSVCHQHGVRIDGISPQEIDHLTLRDFLAVVDAGEPRGIEQFVLPGLAVPDPISAKFLCRGLHARHLAFAGGGANPFDTSAVEALSINHPDVTLYSPAEYHAVARLCDDISTQYSDVKLEYILSESGQVRDRRTHHMVSRYVEAPLDAIIAHQCTVIVCDVNGIAGAMYPEKFSGYGERIVTLDITYGDEALIEIHTIDRKHCLFAVHLDLAMIALCAGGIIMQPV